MFKAPNLQFAMQLLKAVKCNSTELTKLAVICICAWIWIPCALLLRHSYMCFEWELAAFWGMPAHHPGSFPHPFPPSFHCLFSVTGACFPSQCGAHGWVTKNCWPWEKSPSRSCLLMVKAPECFKHPISTWQCSC